MKKLILCFLLVCISCSTLTQKASNGYSLSGKSFYFDSALRKMVLEFSDSTFVITNNYKCENLDVEDKVISAKGTFKVLNDTMYLKYLPIGKKVSIDNCIVKKGTETGNNVWSNDDGFNPNFDTLRMVILKKRNILLCSKKVNRKLYNFFFLEDKKS